MRHMKSGKNHGEEAFWSDSRQGQPSEIVIKSIFAPFLFPFKMIFLLFRLLFLAGGWGMVVTAYCAVLGTGLIGAAGLLGGFLSVKNGFGASLLSFGTGFFSLGLCLLGLAAAGAAAGAFIRMMTGRTAAQRRSRAEEGRLSKFGSGNGLKLAAILLAAGLLTGGIGVLAGGFEHTPRPELPFWHNGEWDDRNGGGGAP
ncbi:hypothetical protein [Saccharibacillus alkalitolerans]|uniref:Uncharacterized protein n=1 Tax=Saccharibacillus alkalitolerans TaxID=2705290 RepID=A0ABX0F2U8_9BACL|nr:hypothetical protein [Saccharibacillus alkalitolerans]NGZ75241.1 hypothetical protein [Saccharibacillus alkalitolerans]